MRKTSTRARTRRGTTAPVALAVAVLTALTGCGIGGDGGSRDGERTPADARPSASPTPRWDTRPGSIAALGDSITRGFHSCRLLADCPEVSWVTGTDRSVQSLASRLLPSPKRGTWNYARTGARMADLPAQVGQAAVRKPELVTVLIGANDACRDSTALMTPVAEFRAGFEASMEALRRALPKTQVYVSSIPDLMRLWSEGRKNPLGKQVWKLGLCASMLGGADAEDRASAERRREVYDRVVAYNTALREVCEADRLCRYDGAVFDYRFTGDHLSRWDWFHPGRQGQEQLAALAHRRITAPE